MLARNLILSLMFLPALAGAQEWTALTVPEDRACIGGGRCGGRLKALRLPLNPNVYVGAVRFHAHDNVGDSAGGEVRVIIDRTTIRDDIDIQRNGSTTTIDLDDPIRGGELTFQAAADDEVVIERVEVRYLTGVVPRPRHNDRPRAGGGTSSGGWRGYGEEGCIGGDQCRKNGKKLTIALDDRPVLGIRFWAHDEIGARADGRISVRIDDTTVSSYDEVLRKGKRHEYEVDGVEGRRLVIEAVSDDEVEISDIEVLYGKRSRDNDGNSGGSASTIPSMPNDDDDRGCIGGEQCGGRGTKIRIRLSNRDVRSIRFRAHDNVGGRRNGALRVRIDDYVLEDALDIDKDGRNYDIDGEGRRGRWLIIEPAKDDEVVVEDVRVAYRR